MLMIERLKTAQDPKTVPHLFGHLGTGEKPVRLAVAANPSTPTDTLRWMLDVTLTGAGEKDTEVREALVKALETREALERR